MIGANELRIDTPIERLRDAVGGDEAEGSKLLLLRRLQRTVPPVQDEVESVAVFA